MRQRKNPRYEVNGREYRGCASHAAITFAGNAHRQKVPRVIKWLTSSGGHFDQVVRAYSGQLYQYAYWLCRDRHCAEDILQDAFARAWKNWDQVEEEAARRSWLYTIVRNEFLRTMQREPSPPAAAPEQFDDDAVLERIDERDFTRGLEIRDVLNRLPEVHLEPLLLQCLVGLSCDEIAAVLGVSTAAAMTRMTRARLALRNLLNESAAPALRMVRIGESK